MRLCEFPGSLPLARSGAAPQAGVWGQGPHDFPKNAVSEQAAQQPTIETGFVLRSVYLDVEQYQSYIHIKGDQRT